jgi:hypothetical protein
MTITTSTVSRRLALIGAGAACVAPAAAVAAPSDTALTVLWREVKALDAAMLPHADAVSAATAESGGLPGWMRLNGEVNRIGEERYRRLVAIINGPVSRDGDLAIKAEAAMHPDIRNGAFTWAGETLALAVMDRLAQAAA